MRGDSEKRADSNGNGDWSPSISFRDKLIQNKRRKSNKEMAQKVLSSLLVVKQWFGCEIIFLFVLEMQNIR